jgi:Mn-dependent DtxR family transcriptional regulator
LKGTDDEPIFDEEKIYKLILTADVNAELEDMEKDGYIDLIEDGDGNEIVFLTEKGKLAANHLIDTTNTYNLIMN